jgi:hypothetical protein
MYVVPSSLEIGIISEAIPARSFDRTDRSLAYKVAITNPSENAAVAGVWAELTRGDATFVSSNQVEYLVGAQDTVVRDRVLRLPPNLAPGTYCLEVMVGGPDFAEVDRDTVMLTKVIDFEEEQFKHGDYESAGSVAVYPQPAVLSSGHLSVEVNPGESSGRTCSIVLYDVNGRLVNKAFGEKIEGTLSLDIDLSGREGTLLAPGVYFLSVDLEDRVFTRKIVLLRH